VLTFRQCGRESPDGFGFCPGCGAPLADRYRRDLVALDSPDRD
jgi:hypothetical protein